MLDDVVVYLRCPHCGGPVSRAPRTLSCPDAHTFDIARQGYVNLLPAGPAKNSGDSAAMLNARQEFLTAGHYAGLADALADVAAVAAEGGQAECVIDMGTGTGYYLAAVLDRLPHSVGIALDLSKAALRMAARAHQRIGAVGCDAWRPLPVAESAADLALNVFAPRDGGQLRRVLRPGGHLIVVTPAAEHLAEIIGPLGLLTVDARKRERLADKLSPLFELVDQREHRVDLALDHGAVNSLVAMGPSAWHVDAAETAARIERLDDPVRVTLASRLSVFR